MRKIYPYAPDVSQAVANKATDVIEKHVVACGVRRAEELPEENKVHLMRELQRLFQAELPAKIIGKDGEEYDWASQGRTGFFYRVGHWLERLFGYTGET
jgi:hypothetical protein